jgi:SAM-dependent methyltransferase/tetratricopeptide (TPR) repeat protein
MQGTAAWKPVLLALVLLAHAAGDCFSSPCQLVGVSTSVDFSCRFASIGNAPTVGSEAMPEFTQEDFVYQHDFCVPEPAINISGRVVVVTRGICEFQKKVRNAVVGGARGVIILMESDLRSAPVPSTNDPGLLNSTLFVVSAAKEEFEATVASLADTRSMVKIFNKHTWCKGALTVTSLPGGMKRKFELFYQSAEVNLDTARALFQKEPAISEQLMLRANFLSPASVEVQLALVALYFSQHKLEEATAWGTQIDARNDVVLSQPQAQLLADAFYNNANKVQRHSYDKALINYDKAIKWKPTAASFYNKAMTLAVMGNINGLLHNAQQAVETIPEENVPWELMTEALSHNSGLNWSEISMYIYEAWTRQINTDVLCSLSSGFLKKQLPASNAFMKLSEALLRFGSGLHSTELEQTISTIRRELLQQAATNRSVSTVVYSRTWRSALASFCFFTAYVFEESTEEKQWLHLVHNQLMTSLTSRYSIHFGQQDYQRLLLLASYRPLHEFPLLSTFVLQVVLQGTLPPELAQTVTEQILEPRKEAQLKVEITSITPLLGEVSNLVNQMYEADPYPRYREINEVHRPPMTYRTFLASNIRIDWHSSLNSPLQFKHVLIAGCGTGQHLIKTACRASDSEILAIDLSKSSLAHAKRRFQSIKGRNMPNVTFAQADITQLTFVERFDAIESVGVLHHLADPMLGWRRLVVALRPNGFMLIGLYTKFRGTSIAAAHQLIKRQGYVGTNADDIRRARTEIGMSPDASVRQGAESGDFATLQGTRDLLFHVQERHYSPLELKTMLQELHLEFVSFICRPKSVLTDYKASFPGDPEATNLDNWHEYELRHPGCHGHMYQFFVRKAEGHRLPT